MINPKLSEDTNDFFLNQIEIYNTSSPTKFGIRVSFERNSKGITCILINYHLMCATLVFVAAINFLIDPNVVPGRAGLLVTLYLVLTSFFTSAQVNQSEISNYLFSTLK